MSGSHDKREARESERIESKGVMQGRSKRMEDVVEGRQTRGSRQSRLAWMGDGGGSEEGG